MTLDTINVTVIPQNNIVKSRSISYEYKHRHRHKTNTHFNNMHTMTWWDEIFYYYYFRWVVYGAARTLLMYYSIRVYSAVSGLFCHYYSLCLECFGNSFGKYTSGSYGQVSLIHRNDLKWISIDFYVILEMCNSKKYLEIYFFCLKQKNLLFALME